MNEKYVLNKYSARFESKELEHNFRQEYLAPYKKRIIFSFGIIILSIIAFAISDLRFLDYSSTFFNITYIRLSVILSFVLLIFVCTRIKNETTIDYSVMAGLLILSSLIVLVNYTRPKDYLLYLTLDAVIVFAYYVFLSTRFIFQIIPAVFLSVSDLIVTFSTKEIPEATPMFVILLSFFLANLLGGYVAYRYHISNRIKFSSLQHEKHLNKRINDALEIVSIQKEKLEEFNIESIRSKRLYVSLTENTYDILFSLDKEGKFTYIGPQVQRYGYSQEEIKNRYFHKFIYPDDNDFVTRRLKEVFVGGDDDILIQFRIMGKDGSIFWFEEHGKIQYDDFGEIVGITGVFRDITVRKSIEEDKERLITELKDALDNIKKLKELIPICSNCKKIRNDDGFYEQVEEYISDQTGLQFSHGICPECLIELYPDFCKKKDTDNSTE